MNWDAEVDVVVVGGGGGGLVAALTAAEAGLEVALFEKTDFLLGNTAASAGMIPACNTRFQKLLGIEDSAETMTQDILEKNHFESDIKQVGALASISGPLVEWLNDSLNIEMSVVTEFKYPGHSNFRMHAPPSRSGLELMKLLKRNALNHENLYILYQSDLEEILLDKAGEILGISINTPDGLQNIRGKKVILATNGFGGNAKMVQDYIPEISDALYFGYEANTGKGIEAGKKIGAATTHLTAYQGHAAVNENTGLLVTWGTIMMGGFYINIEGNRFGNEAHGYSEFAKEVLIQPDQYGFIIYDEEIHNQLQTIEDYKQLTEMKAYKKADFIDTLAKLIHVDEKNLTDTFEIFSNQIDGLSDEFERTSFAKKLTAPFYAIKVSPALFHTQGGLQINEQAQVLTNEGTPMQDLYAVGGCATGISGKEASGYMSGNGLLAAMGFGRIAGLHTVNHLKQISRGI